jgi:mannose-6-phosphate isomerase-like protein (cupin superfamily)
MPDIEVLEPLLGRLVGGLPAGFVIAEWTDPGGGFDPPMLIAPLHIHHEDDEAWYVLEGKMAVRCGDSVFEVGPGACAFVPRGNIHTFWNPEPGPARYLVVMASRTKDLIDHIHAASDRSPDAMGKLFAAHQSEYLGF